MWHWDIVRSDAFIILTVYLEETVNWPEIEFWDNLDREAEYLYENLSDQTWKNSNSNWKWDCKQQDAYSTKRMSKVMFETYVAIIWVPEYFKNTLKLL